MHWLRVSMSWLDVAEDFKFEVMPRKLCLYCSGFIQNRRQKVYNRGVYVVQGA